MDRQMSLKPAGGSDLSQLLPSRRQTFSGVSGDLSLGFLPLAGHNSALAIEKRAALRLGAALLASYQRCREIDDHRAVLGKGFEE